MAHSVTCAAPSNIATIKYWGKRDEELILPINDSISVTLSEDLLRAKTTVSASPNFSENRFWLNGREEVFSDNKRLVNCLAEIRERASREGDGRSAGIYDWKIHICSENNFPTAAGLASSAAGYACLVYALGHLYGLKGDLTSLARRGSGSACRSLSGGFVRWHMGVSSDGSDSIASQIAPQSHWPEMRVLILIVREKKKLVSSTSGMKTSVLTSELIQHRAQHVVPARVQNMISAIQNKDFQRFAEITMKESNQFHAIALDTFPPAVYMTDVSHSIAALVHAFNASCGTSKVCYTFDAGANACLFLEEQNVPLVVALIKHYFPEAGDNWRGKAVKSVPLPKEIIGDIPLEPMEPGLIKGVIFSSVGNGPKVLPDGDTLLDSNGIPLSLAL